MMIVAPLACGLAPAGGATLPSLVQTRVKLSGVPPPPASSRIQKATVLSPRQPPAAPLQEGVAVPFVTIDPTNQTLRAAPPAAPCSEPAAPLSTLEIHPWCSHGVWRNGAPPLII